MNNAENILVVSSFVLLSILVVIGLKKTVLQMYAVFRPSKVKVKFSKFKLNKYCKYLTFYSIIWSLYSLVIAQGFNLWLQASILGVAILAVGLFVIIMYEFKED
jgi:hypothetical protein